MNLAELIYDKGLRSKEKNEIISRWILDDPGNIDKLIDIADGSKDVVKAGCIEAIEYVTRNKPEIATPKCLRFISRTLQERAPHIKWESARVISNIAELYPDFLDLAVKNLLENTNHPGTVVRWSAAMALGEILKLNTRHNKLLIPAIEAISKSEPKNSIKKTYQMALKKVKS